MQQQRQGSLISVGLRISPKPGRSANGPRKKGVAVRRLRPHRRGRRGYRDRAPVLLRRDLEQTQVLLQSPLSQHFRPIVAAAKEHEAGDDDARHRPKADGGARTHINVYAWQQLSNVDRVVKNDEIAGRGKNSPRRREMCVRLFAIGVNERDNVRQQAR